MADNGDKDSADRQQQQQPQGQQQQQPQQATQTPVDNQPPPSPNGSPGVNNATPSAPSTRKRGADRLRRACIACHSGKTRCSEVLPCQSCLKRGLGATCTYPESEPGPNGEQQIQLPPPSAPPPQTQIGQPPTGSHPPAATTTPYPPVAPHLFPVVHAPPNMATQQFYDYNGTYTGATSSTFRPSKRARNNPPEPVEDPQNHHSIPTNSGSVAQVGPGVSRNYTRGEFYIGSSPPVRIDPRLPVRLQLGEGGAVHIWIADA